MNKVNDVDINIVIVSMKCWKEGGEKRRMGEDGRRRVSYDRMIRISVSILASWQGGED